MTDADDGASTATGGWDALSPYDRTTERATELRGAARRRNAVIGGLMLTLLAGMSVGGLITRQRYRAQSVIAAINGQIIDQDAFTHRLELASGQDVIRHMVDEKLQNQYAAKLGIVVTESEITARYNELSARPNFMAYLVNTHQSPEDVANQIRMEMIVNKIVGRAVQVTEADVAGYYRHQTDHSNPTSRFYTPPNATIAVISTTNKERIDRAKHELDRGADFETISAAYSDDLTARDHGGELPPIARGRSIYANIPGFDKTVFSMKEGETSDPIRFGSLWTIIRCLKQEPEVTIPRDKVEYECREGALMAKLPQGEADRIRDAYVRFQHSAAIRSFRPEYRVSFGNG